MSGDQIAEYGNATTYFVHKDHLGSTRLITDINGNNYDLLDFLPFGEQAASDTGTTHKFTGKERDSETNFDNFGARYFTSAYGRFISPDEPLADEDTSDPQSWNLYTNVRNNSLSHIVPDGRKCAQADDERWYDDGTGHGCDKAGVDAIGKITPQKITVGVGEDEANLFMLQSNGGSLSSPRQWDDIAQHAHTPCLLMAPMVS